MNVVCKLVSVASQAGPNPTWLQALNGDAVYLLYLIMFNNL